MNTNDIVRELISNQTENRNFREKEWEAWAHPDTALDVFKALVKHKAWDHTVGMVAQYLLKTQPHTQVEMMRINAKAVATGLMKNYPVQVQPTIMLIDYLRENQIKDLPNTLGSFMERAIVDAQFGTDRHALLMTIVDVPEFSQTYIKNGLNLLPATHAWCRSINIMVLNKNMANWKQHLGIILRSGIDIDSVAQIKKWEEDRPCTALAWCAARYDGTLRDRNETRHLKDSIIELVAHGADWTGLDLEDRISGRLINALPRVVAYKRSVALGEIAQTHTMGSQTAAKPKI